MSIGPSLVSATKEEHGEETTSSNHGKSDVQDSPNLDRSPESTTPADEPPAPPNGGLVAWLQVAAGFMLFFNTWGIINTFAVFQVYYESGELFTASLSDISWIGSTQCLLLELTGLIAGPIYDRGHLRLLLSVGSFLTVFGFMMLSLCQEYWQALLAQGFCVGIGAGLLFTPTVSLIPTYFSTRIGLAMGIASSGSSFGGIVYPIVLNKLLGQIGFTWAVRVVGFIALGTFILPLAVMRMRVRLPKPRAIIDWSAFVDVPFMVFTLGLLLVFIGNTVLIFYISYYPFQRGFTDQSLSFYIVAIFNASSIFGRIVPNAVSDRIGAFNTMAPITIVLGVSVYCMLAVSNVAGMIVLAIATGFLSGVVIALPPVCFRLLTENKSMIGTRNGQGFAIAGIGLIIGGPGAGAILGAVSPLDWTGVWVLSGTAGVLGGVFVLIVRVMKAGFVPRIKV